MAEHTHHHTGRPLTEATDNPNLVESISTRTEPQRGDPRVAGAAATNVTEAVAGGKGWHSSGDLAKQNEPIHDACAWEVREELDLALEPAR